MANEKNADAHHLQEDWMTFKAETGVNLSFAFLLLSFALDNLPAEKSNIGSYGLVLALTLCAFCIYCIYYHRQLQKYKNDNDAESHYKLKQLFYIFLFFGALLFFSSLIIQKYYVQLMIPALIFFIGATITHGLYKNSNTKEKIFSVFQMTGCCLIFTNIILDNSIKNKKTLLQNLHRAVFVLIGLAGLLTLGSIMINYRKILKKSPNLNQQTKRNMSKSALGTVFYFSMALLLIGSALNNTPFNILKPGISGSIITKFIAGICLKCMVYELCQYRREKKISHIYRAIAFFIFGVGSGLISAQLFGASLPKWVLFLSPITFIIAGLISAGGSLKEKNFKLAKFQCMGSFLFIFLLLPSFNANGYLKDLSSQLTLAINYCAFVLTFLFGIAVIYFALNYNNNLASNPSSVAQISVA